MPKFIINFCEENPYFPPYLIAVQVYDREFVLFFRSIPKYIQDPLIQYLIASLRMNKLEYISPPHDSPIAIYYSDAAQRAAAHIDSRNFVHILFEKEFSYERVAIILQIINNYQTDPNMHPLATNAHKEYYAGLPWYKKFYENFIRKEVPLATQPFITQAMYNYGITEMYEHCEKHKVKAELSSTLSIINLPGKTTLFSIPKNHEIDLGLLRKATCALVANYNPDNYSAAVTRSLTMITIALLMYAWFLIHKLNQYETDRPNQRRPRR